LFRLINKTINTINTTTTTIIIIIKSPGPLRRPPAPPQPCPQPRLPPPIVKIGKKDREELKRFFAKNEPARRKFVFLMPFFYR